MSHEHDNRPAIRYCSACGAPVEPREALGKMRLVCTECGQVQFRDPKVAAGVIVIRDGEALLVRRRHDPLAGQWSLPAGFVDGGEDPRRAAERECLEETGLEVEVADLVDVIYGREHAAGADLMLVYRAGLIRGEPRADDDASEVRFFGPQELPALAFESTRRVLQRWADGELSRVL